MNLLYLAQSTSFNKGINKSPNERGEGAVIKGVCDEGGFLGEGGL